MDAIQSLINCLCSSELKVEMSVRLEPKQRDNKYRGGCDSDSEEGETPNRYKV